MEISTRQIGLKYGAILGFASIFYSSILFVTGNNTNQALGYLFYVVVGIVLFLAFKEFKKFSEGYMSFGEGFRISFWIMLVLSILSAIFMYVYVDIIDPTIIETIKEQQLLAFEQQGLNDEQIEQAAAMSSKFMTPSIMAASAFFVYLIFGIIIGLIMSLIFKNARPEFE